MASKLSTVVTGAAAAAMAVSPAHAQFGGILGSAPQDVVNDAQAGDSGCAQGRKKSTAGSLLGGLLGRAAQNAAARAGISSWMPISEVSGVLTDAIACRLQPEEQKQAAEATLLATRSVDDGSDEIVPVEVGSTAEWESETRADVSGSSTVTAREASVDGADCITVTDVVIVKGEETTAEKRMCRPPGSRRYSIIA